MSLRAAVCWSRFLAIGLVVTGLVQTETYRDYSGDSRYVRLPHIFDEADDDDLNETSYICGDCSEIRNDTDGYIANPTQNGIPLTNCNCSWTLIGEENTNFIIQLLSFVVESFLTWGRCLKISDEETNFISFCGEHGHTSERKFQTDSNKAYITFVDTKPGYYFKPSFRIEYKQVPVPRSVSCEELLNAAESEIKTPGDMGITKSDINCSFPIQVPKRHKIGITIEKNGTDDSTEEFEIMDGRNSSLGSFSTGTEFIVPGTKAVVKLSTQNKLQLSGLKLKWKKIGCFNEMRVLTGFINSSEETGNLCRWIIEVPSNHSIELKIEQLKFQTPEHCSSGHLQIYEGEDEAKPPLVRLCGIHENITLTSTTNRLTLKLTSYSVPKGNFTASYKTVAGCGGFYHVNTGSIYVPESSVFSPQASYCEWKIQVQEYFSVKLTLKNVVSNTSQDQPCNTSNIRVYDSTNENKSLADVCESELKVQEIHSHGNLVTIRRYNSHPRHQPGFQVSFETACGTFLHVNNGGKLTANVPEHFEECFWILKANNPGEQVGIVIVDGNLAANDEKGSYIRFFDGETTAVFLGEAKSNSTVQVLTSTQRSMRIQTKNAGLSIAYMPVEGECPPDSQVKVSRENSTTVVSLAPPGKQLSSSSFAHKHFPWLVLLFPFYLLIGKCLMQ